MQVALTLTQNKVEGRPIDANVAHWPDNLDEAMLLVTAATQISASLVTSFDEDPATVIAQLRMNALEATS
jgi:hypothetical protein